ncbi:glycosyltransferase family 87 protein [Haloplanus salilacus]|uniref:glycosyltransferase family 87 protein n=1 Tax=Haloplanus salilacus TaxID=2949994 RepID=UPI0030D60F55
MSVLRRLLARRGDRPVFVAVALLASLVLFVHPAVDHYLRLAGIAPRFGFWDFGAYSNAVGRWRAGESFYVQSDGGGYHGSYLYPPVVLLAFAPFVLAFPFATAAPTWAVCTVLVLWVAIQRLASALGCRLHPVERLLSLPVVAGFQPLLLSVKMGQTAGLLGALLAFAAATSLRGRGYASGVFTGVCGVIKLPYAPAGTHLLADRRRFAGAVGGGVVLLVCSVLVFGIGAHLTYLEVLEWGVRMGSDARSPRLWLPPYYRPLYGVPYSLALRLLASLAVVGLALRAADDGDAVRETTALGFAAVPLLAPLAYAYYFVAAVPAVVLLVAAELDRPEGSPTLPVVGLLLFHAHSYGLRTAVKLAPEWVPAGPLQPGLWGNLLLVGLAALRVAQAGAGSPLSLRRAVTTGRE